MSNRKKLNKPVKDDSVGMLVNIHQHRFNPDGKVSFNFSKISKDFSFDHKEFSSKHYINFCQAIMDISDIKWSDAYTSQKHSRIGTEHLPLKKFHPHKDVQKLTKDEDKLTIFRYHGNLPMAGLRKNDIFYVLFIESKYGDLYDHG